MLLVDEASEQRCELSELSELILRVKPVPDLLVLMLPELSETSELSVRVTPVLLMLMLSEFALPIWIDRPVAWLVLWKVLIL